MHPNEDLSPVAGEFVDAARETAFQTERLSETVRSARLFFIFSAGLHTLFLASDWRIYGQEDFWLAVPVRLAVVAASLLGWTLMQKAKTFRQAETITVLGLIATAVPMAFLVSSGSEIALLFALIRPSIFYLIVPISFRWSLIAGGACSLLMLTGCLADGSITERTLGVVLVALALNFGLYLVVLGSNRVRRLGWVATQEVRRTANKLAGALEAAQHATQAKSEFLATMSHEIRTPLHAITGLTRLILDRKDLNPDLRRQIALIDISGSALFTVVNDVLDFSKIEAGAIELDPKPFWPKAMMENCASIVRTPAIDKKLTLHVETGGTLPNRVIGDEPRVRQVLLNLLNNAIKFTPAGGITLSLHHESVSDTHDRLRFSVTDTGIGIPASKRDRVFKQFSQLDSSTSRQYGGTGLGLAICKQLVELMGGSIGFDSEPGRGSTFWFDVALPRTMESRGANSDRAETPEVKGPRARILLAEDVEINQEIAKAILENAGYEVSVVSNGAEAVVAVQNSTYDLVLMDVQMPVMNGIVATQHIRALPLPASTVPIIAMTANVFADQIASCREAGMNGHIGKPFPREDLALVIARSLKNRGAAAA